MLSSTDFSLLAGRLAGEGNWIQGGWDGGLQSRLHLRHQLGVQSIVITSQGDYGGEELGQGVVAVLVRDVQVQLTDQEEELLEFGAVIT